MLIIINYLYIVYFVLLNVCLTNYLMGFDDTSKLRGEIDVTFILWVIDVDEDSPLSIWLVDSIIKLHIAFLTIILIGHIADET